MAAPPADINAILAALAAQNRTGATPSQATPAPAPGLPPGFPGAYPQQSATPSIPGYPLPQPTNSGSVDLSSIRPVNTGSVSIQEAIAKARSIAADRGRDDPRLAGRPYRRSRSRSRSPGRNGRDSYNPYRDERRGDAGRAGYGRDRSPSPRRGGQDNFSPKEKDSETITVKSALVGLIIGRAGENLRRVEAETGARVQFVPAREPGAQRQCTISGTLRQREAAKREIFQTIEDNGGGGGAAFDTRGSSAGRSSVQPPMSTTVGVGRDGEQNRQILVPDKTVGLIIGRGGETIRDLQDRSGCHVNIVGENKSINGRRPVNLVGTKEAADKAEAIIWEIVESDAKNHPERQRQGDPYGGMQQQQQQQQHRGGDGDVSESIHVPSGAVGMIIGKGGESIKEMQASTGCKINVHTPGNPDYERQIDLVGTRSSVEAAKRVIWDKVDTAQSRDRQKGGNSGRDRDDGGYGSHQQQQPSYGQQPPPQGYAAAMPGMPAAAPPASGDAADPYAQYGGYNNYIAMWFAAMQQQQQGGQQPPAQ